MTDDTAVKVVVRIRPQISRDILDLCHVCTRTVPNEQQVWIGNDKSYTFDQVFDMPTPQDDIFDVCVKELVDGCFDGYNATVLAYGQTGSGKTYTMGSGFDHNFNVDERGIIPRAVEHLFQRIEDIQEKEKEKGCTPPEFKVNAQFMELYNEEVIDLLDTTRDLDNKKRTHVRIHEDADGKIYTHGVIAQCVTDEKEALHCLKIGSLSRTTASTGMNTQSSRSHAIFTLHIKQQRVVKLGKGITGDDTCNSSLHKHTENLNEFETLTAKFHFVDLAGSERLKRTGATGDRQKESICINSGLLALGNVISALGDRSKKATHVPYRDSKLTRLLQDSLGGNSRTLMIACVSPSDRDFVETLSTLKYANRAKNIRNKVTANKDKSSQTINALMKQVQNLQLEILEFKQGKRLLGEDGAECINDMYHENTMLQSENNSLKMRVKVLQETIDRLTTKNTALLIEKRSGEWILNGDGTKSDITSVIQEYVTEIERLQTQLVESREEVRLLRKSALKFSPQSAFSPTSTVAITGHYDIRIDTCQSVTEILEEAKKNVKKLKRKEKKLKGLEKEISVPSDEEKEVAEENENDDDQEEENSSSDSDEEKTEQDEKLSENLAEITCDISLKEKLIRQLEISQKRLHNMRQHYEEKIAQLQTKIIEAEKERDKIISNLSKTAESKSEERRIRADYEKKISSLKNDVKNFENAKKHHVQLMTSATNSEGQLKKLKQEVAEMKRTKVTLLNKMKEESKKFRDSEQKRNREIALLKKEKLNKDSQIKALEAEKKRKEIVLKKRAEEILNLRKKTVKYVSPKSIRQLKPGPYQHKAAKQRWQTLEKKISRLVLNKQNIAAIEKDMDRWLKEREKIGRYLDKIIRKRDRALIEQGTPKVIEEFEDEIESLKANIEYIHENLSECQSAITGLEEAKENICPEDVINSLNNLQLEESYYIIEKIVLMAIDQSFQNSQKEVIIKELESQLAQVIDNSAVQEQLLFHVVQQANEHLAGFIELTAANMEETDNSGSESRSRSPSPDDSITPRYSIPSFSRESTFVSDKQKRRKARNIAATTEQLLFSSAEPQFNSNTFSEGKSQALASTTSEKSNGDLNSKSLSYVVLPALKPDANGNNPFQQIEAAEKRLSALSEFKPVIAGSGLQSSYLISSHVVDGHDRAVLCVECTDDVLFSSSADGVVKIWDLMTNTEIQKLDHSEAVRKVCYCEYTRRAFAASSSEVTLWDVRQNPATCNHIFRSSGLDPTLTSEYEINDIALNQYGTLLYAASSRSIRVWDLRMLQCLGALDIGYGSNATCIAVSDVGFEKNRIVCGSQDKSIKVFEIREDDYGLHQPKYSLSPPHFDGVQALAVADHSLFSGGRDMSIRKWDLDKRSLDYDLSQVHNNWICALEILQDRNCLLSGCKSGYLKLWSVDKCHFLEEIVAHRSSINSITSNNSLVFTASSDCTIGVWKMKSETNFRLRR